MACGACGGGNKAARAMQSRVVNQQVNQQANRQSKLIAKPSQIPVLRPTATTKIVVATQNNTAIKVKQQLKDLKNCPLCNAPLTHIVSGSGIRNRKSCPRCRKTFI
jgi:hypothetical protein